MASIVSLRNVVKRYTRGKQSVEVLHELNLEIQKGEFVALMGPSGSGKTTLLNLIGGLDNATAGEVLVAGERIDKLSAIFKPRSSIMLIASVRKYSPFKDFLRSICSSMAETSWRPSRK